MLLQLPPLLPLTPIRTAVIAALLLVFDATALQAAGTGTRTLSGANTNSGQTTVRDGTLMVKGSLAASSVVVANGGTLGGSGTIKGAVAIQAGGVLAPGANGSGSLHINDTLTLDSAGLTVMTIDGVNKTNATITCNKSVTLTGKLKVTNVGVGPPRDGDSYTLFKDTQLSGDFTAFDLPILPGWLA